MDSREIALYHRGKRDAGSYMSVTNDYFVSGMSCGHCVHAVAAEVAALAGVLDVQVDLDPAGSSVVHVTSEAALPLDAVAAAIDSAGYDLAGAA